ncbi:uroporphyrinogen-III C-methyltransferase [Testudinibacter sp. P27/CKL/0425]
MSEQQTPENRADLEKNTAVTPETPQQPEKASATVGAKTAVNKKPAPKTEPETKAGKSGVENKPLDKKAADNAKSAVKPETNERTARNQPAEKSPSGGGKGLSLLAILIALGVGVGGYFWGTQQLSAVEQQVTTLSSELAKLQNQTAPAAPQAPAVVQDNGAEALKAQFGELQAAQQKAVQQTQRELQQLAAALDLQKTENSELRNQLNKLSFNNKSEPNDWLMSEADFLLTNAQRKLVLDNDIETVVTLLQAANQTLQQVSNSQALSIRTAIGNDLTQLQNINEVDQDLIMSQLSLLVSQVDNLKVLALNPSHKASAEVSESIEDWQQNLEKSASSFLSHFIQVRKKDQNRPELLAPDQDVFLKENIRLSLQVALSAVPRQQNEVYKQSLNSVASWVRSYFDTDDYSVQQFLQQVDQLKEQSIYVNAPQQLQSWLAIGTLLNRDYRTLEQFSSSEAAKAKAAEEKAAEEKAAEEKAAEEKPVEAKAVEPKTEPKIAAEPVSEQPSSENSTPATVTDNASENLAAKTESTSAEATTEAQPAESATEANAGSDAATPAAPTTESAQ